MYELRKINKPSGFYREKEQFVEQQRQQQQQHEAHASRNKAEGCSRFNTKRICEMRIFMNALERSLVNELRFKKRLQLLRSDQLTISQSVFNQLRDKGVRCKFTSGWCWLSTTFASLGMRPVSDRLYCSDGLRIAIRPDSFKIKIRTRHPISFNDGKDSRQTSATYTFSYEFLPNQYY